MTTAPDWAAKLDATATAWETDERGDRVLSITAQSPVPDLSVLGADRITVSAEEIPADVRTLAEGPTGTTVRIRFRAADLLVGSAATGQRRIVSAQVGAFDVGRALGAANATGAAGAVALRSPRLRHPRPLVLRRGARFFAMTPTVDGSGRLMISVVPLTSQRVGAHIRRMLGRQR
jgi:hypothetical protein